MLIIIDVEKIGKGFNELSDIKVGLMSFFIKERKKSCQMKEIRGRQNIHKILL